MQKHIAKEKTKRLALTTALVAVVALASQDKIKDRSAYEFFKGLDANGKPIWTSDVKEIHPVFTDSNGASTGGVVYNPGIKRYILTSFHTGPGQLGIFDAPEPWGPWTTVAYYDSWGNMGTADFGLNCDFPQKWMGTDGLTMWCVFSVYGDGAKKGINGHDKFNLVKATLSYVNYEERWVAAHPTNNAGGIASCEHLVLQPF